VTEELPRRAILRDGRRVPVFTVIGPGGTGKSTLAMRMAQMITRAEGGPNVLLVDADLFSRGITASLETRVEVSCGSLHDALFGRQARVQPLDLSAVAGAIDEQQPLQNDEGVVDEMRLAHLVCALVSDTLPRDRSELAPGWLAPLPKGWRSIARRVAQNPPGGWLIFRRILSGRQGVIALATVAGLLLLTWLGYGQGGPDSRTFVTIGLGLTIVAAGALAAWTTAQSWRCLGVARRLRGADLRWLLTRIELRPSEVSTCSARVRLRRTRRRLRSLTRVFAALSRTIEPESPARQGPEMGPLSQDAPPASAR